MNWVGQVVGRVIATVEVVVIAVSTIMKSVAVVSVVPMLTMSITVVLRRCGGRRQSEADNKKSDSRDDSVHLDWLA